MFILAVFLQAIPGLKILSTPFPLSFSGVSVDEVLLCEDGAALPPVLKDDEGLLHCEGVLHLPPYIREGQASVGDEKELTESVHHLPPHLAGVVLLSPGVGGDEDL